MVLTENITYPVILEPDTNRKGGTTITFPAFKGKKTYTTKDPIKAAQEVITLEVINAECDGKPLPKYNDSIKVKRGQKLVYVNVWMPYHRTLFKTAYVRKNLILPVWLEQLAKADGINFSETLSEALREKLGLTGKK